MATEPRTRRRWLILAALGTAHLAVLFVGPLAKERTSVGTHQPAA